MLLIRLSLESSDAHGPLRQWHVLIHLHFDPIDVELLTVTLYLLALVGNGIWPFQLLILHRPKGILVLIQVVIILAHLDGPL